MSKETYFDYLTKRLDNGESRNVVIPTTINSIEKQLGKKKRIRVLDVGCFSGAMLHRIYRELPEQSKQRVDLFGIDIDVKPMLYGSSKYKIINYSLANLEKDLPFKSTFDVVILCNVLHELFPNEDASSRKKMLNKAFKQICDVLSDQGELVLLDGVIPTNPKKMISVEFADQAWVNRFLKLKKEYKAKKIFASQPNINTIEMDLMSLSIFLAKEQYLDEDYWDSELHQLYQYFGENDFKQMIKEAHLEIMQFQPQFYDEKKQTLFNKKMVLPPKNILLVARKVDQSQLI